MSAGGGGVITPTANFRWTDARDNEEVPRASIPGWPECGPSHYKLQQWCLNGLGDGFWRDVRYGISEGLSE